MKNKSDPTSQLFIRVAMTLSAFGKLYVRAEMAMKCMLVRDKSTNMKSCVVICPALPCLSSWS